jgi:26S proteasome regulatory subunit N2
MCYRSRPHIRICISQRCREFLYESPDLPIEARNSAALLASKVYYYLEEYDEALTFALGAGSAFQQDSGIPGDEEYIETLTCELYPEIHGLPLNPAISAKAIDRYIESRIEDQSGTQAKVDPRLQDIIEGIFSQCIQNGEYKQASLSLSSLCVSLSAEQQVHCRPSVLH